MLVYLCELYRVLLLIKQACTKCATGTQMLSLYVHCSAPTGTGILSIIVQLKSKWDAKAACVTASHVLDTAGSGSSKAANVQWTTFCGNALVHEACHIY